MRMHLQGVFLLIVLLLTFWAALEWGGGVIGSALTGDDGAIVARAPVDSGLPDGESDAPLDNVDVAELQTALAAAGFDPGPVDGILGDRTRRAIDQALGDLRLGGSSDRALLQHLVRQRLSPAGSGSNG